MQLERSSSHLPLAVEPPASYKDARGLSHAFSEIDKTIQEQYTHLLQFVSQEADFAQEPTLTTYDCQGTILKILNFTNSILKFNEKRDLFINDDNLATFDSTNCNIVVYPLTGFEDVMVIEGQNEGSPIIQRSFIADAFSCIKSSIRARIGEKISDEEAKSWVSQQFLMADFSYLKTQLDVYDSRCLSRHSIQVVDVENFLKTDVNYKTLTREVPFEATLMQKPSVTCFKSRINNSDMMTVVNHTNFPIALDIDNNIIVNGSNFNQSVKEGNRTFLAYYIENDLENICVENKFSNVIEVGTRFFLTCRKGFTTECPFPEIFENIQQKKEAVYQKLWTIRYDPSFIFREAGVLEIWNQIVSKYIRC